MKTIWLTDPMLILSAYFDMDVQQLPAEWPKKKLLVGSEHIAEELHFEG